MTNLLILIVNCYATLFLVRFFIPNTGQMYFNEPYQLIIRATNPFCRLFRTISATKKYDVPALLSFAVVMAMKSLLFINRNNALLITGPGLFYSAEIKFIYYVSRDVLAVAHFSIMEYLSFLFKTYILIFVALQIAAGQRLYNNVLLVCEQFLNSLMTLVYFRRVPHNIYIRPLRSFVYIFILFTVLDSLLFFSGEKLGILSFSSKSFFFCFSKSILISFYFLLNILRLILPLLFIRVVLSWFSPRETVLYQMLIAVTEPVFRPFEKLNMRVWGIDFSPVLAFFFVYLLLDFFMLILNNLYVLV